MKFVPSAVSRKAGMALLKTQKNSPKILFVVGVAGMVGSTVLACKSTLKVSDTLEEIKSDLDLANSIQHSSYTDEDRQKDITIIYLQGAGKMAKLYGPSIALGVASIVCLTKSHNILVKRNAALASTLAVVTQAFNEYRGRVVEELGEEKDAQFRYGSESVTLLEETETGPKKVRVNRVGADGASMYAKMFEEGNANWSPIPESNRIFLNAQQAYANQRLRAKGYLMLNDVYDSLGIPRTTAGCVVGWVWNNGDDYVDFGLGDWPNADDFRHGAEGAILLDFNVDGDVHTLIEEA